MSNYVRNATGRSPNLGTYSEYFKAVYGVYKPSRGGNYTSQIMRDPVSYGTGANDWRVKDGGRWWLRDSTYSEPNGDYHANALLGLFSSFPTYYNLTDLSFNDEHSNYLLKAPNHVFI